ncbi:ParA family protein [[Mycobacterium] nativiensis]|uniref:ParA family protein n=1 Tax=[Mycobacterium] nativiensis TaxID=2855503 RepID=A0ABU5XZP8_9MYCO|nr:ParA family protein [Mycolicibacter sp. MYC340]MEB3033323.1 ParA family protein [Mycolicibacter sp. MYC340]
MSDSTVGEAVRSTAKVTDAPNGAAISPRAHTALERLGIASSPELRALLPRLIVTVAAWKGGVGKTEIAKELAYLLDGVLVDLDWDEGGATRNWGYRHEARTTAPLLDALDSGRVPRPLSGGGVRADLIPSHPDFAINQPAADRMATTLEHWSQALGRPLVIDTHPGGVPSTMGAVGAAHVVVVPVNLETRALRATEGMAQELQGGFPLLFVLNRVEAAPESELKQLEKLSEMFDIPVGPVVSSHAFLKRRKLTMAVCAPGRSGEIPARAAEFVGEMHDVAKRVLETAVLNARAQAEGETEDQHV